MGVGKRNLINICTRGQQEGTESIEENTEVLKQVWAEVRDLSSGNSFTGFQSATTRTYEFLIDVDSDLPLDFFNLIIEWFNFVYKIMQVDRGDRISRGKDYSFEVNQDGSYYRIVAESESYG